MRAPRNRTINISDTEGHALLSRTLSLSEYITTQALENRIINQNLFECVSYLPDAFIDLLVIDPPYNLNKRFGKTKFSKRSDDSYEEWVESWMKLLVRCLKRDASIYVCCDWQSSASVQKVLDKLFTIRNRITCEREKGRGAKANWKNCSEDIWFCTASEDYNFDVEAVKLKRKVIAPYRHSNGDPKDWEEAENGNYRLTHPSNLWTDISIPFWSMSENTDHPTQKPEKLIAKLILASSRLGDFVFDPFVGSGSTAVVAKKLGRRFAGIELESEYCQMTMKRLDLAERDSSIQGYHDGYFWERNSLNDQRQEKTARRSNGDDHISESLFDVLDKQAV
ncbi:MAG: DNA-methyltransferase [Rhabdochlamydiaceae bacterium]